MQQRESFGHPEEKAEMGEQVLEREREERPSSHPSDSVESGKFSDLFAERKG